MTRGGIATLAVACLLLVPLGAGLTTHPQPQDHEHPLERVLATQSSLEAVSPATAAAGDLARAGMLFATDPARSSQSPATLLEAVIPLLAARDQAAAKLTGGSGAPLHDPVKLARAAHVLKAAEQAPSDLGGMLATQAGATAQQGLGDLAALQTYLPHSTPGTGEHLLETLALGGSLIGDGELPVGPSFPNLTSAVVALTLEAGSPPGYLGDPMLERLDAIGPSPATALTRIIEAHLVQTEATERALATPGGPDLGLLAAAREHVARTVLTHVPALVQLNAVDELSICGVLSLDLAGTDSTYNCEYRVQVDVAGDDVYRNSAGGADALGANAGAALLIDLAGDDTYDQTFGNAGADEVSFGGAGNLGSGFLYDASGNDTYTAEVTATGSMGAFLATNGGGNYGAGALIDRGGDDAYTTTVRYQATGGLGMEGGLHGGGQRGIGLLYDGGGEDTYRVHVDHSLGGSGDTKLGIHGGGELQSLGLLVDGGGDDRYVTTVNATGGSGSMEVGVLGGSVFKGIGVLLEEGGADVSETQLRLEIEDGNLFTGVGGGTESGTALLVDREGHDARTVNITSLGGDVGTWAGIHGGASSQGTALLRDEQGNDENAVNVTAHGATVKATLAAHGGGVTGAGFLDDLAGDDRYTTVIDHVATGPESDVFLGANGGAEAGLGYLRDQGGDDVYQATIRHTAHGSASDILAGANGGADLGIAVLLDEGGADRYESRLQHTVHGSQSNVFAGLNGGAESGAAYLIDQGGDDAYEALLDHAPHAMSSDLYVGAHGGGSTSGTGVLADRAGNDTYTARIDQEQATVATAIQAGLNGGASIGTGLLHDAGGTNRFTASIGAFPAAADPWNLAAGIHGGASGPTSLRTSAQAASYPGGLGLLFTGAGDDTYVSNGTTQGAARSYGVGVLRDAGGSNSYLAGADPLGAGLAQGAADHGALGLLLDHGNSTLTLASGATGQGVGLQGAGLLLLTNEQADVTLESAPTATSGLLDGAGFGLRALLGTATLLGAQPSFTCEGSAELLGATETVDPGVVADPVAQVDVHVCAPDPSTNRPILDPRTGEPMEPVEREPTPCRQVEVAGNDCSDLSEDVADFLEDDEVTMTTNGGTLLQLLRLPASTGGQGPGVLSLQGQHVIATVDGMCRHGCVQQT